MKYIDLHVHSNESDGTYTPAQLVDYAIEKGLAAFALTDHDTTKGLAEAVGAAKGRPIEVIPGIEFSTEYEGRDIHIVGLDFDYEDQEFQSQLKRFRDSRDLRNEKMIRKLNEAGIKISWEDMESRFGEAVWTRAHFARFMLDEGYIKSMPEAFERYIGDRGPCYVPREKVTPSQAVHLVRRAGGIPVLAHPLLYHLSSERLKVLVEELKKRGLLGLEAVYSTHKGYEEDEMRRLARTTGLCISGGSDFHGSNKPAIDLGCGRGNLKIPYEILKQLRAAGDGDTVRK